jgi:oligopeptide transport system ATP-binding protein
MSGVLLELRGVGVEFGGLPALQGVSFDLMAGETLGLVGESGSGKSTLARAILRLIPLSAGRVLFQGEDLGALGGAQLRRRRRDLQIVFQDPLASLNPRLSVGETLSEPLRIHEPAITSRMRASRVAEMLERVGLPADAVRRHPHEFSGGQCQRIGIARAMILRPKLLVCDEAVSALDVSVQGQIVNLLADLQRDLGMAMLFIGHNLAVIRQLSHRILVIYQGRLVERADRDALFAEPVHPYTRSLLAAVPQMSGLRAVEPLAAAVDSSPDRCRVRGCAYEPRCAYAQEDCARAVPALEEVAARHAAACHHWRQVVYS